jgi:GTP cyclohydrolase I
MDERKVSELVRAFLNEIGYDMEDTALGKTPERVAAFVAELIADSKRDYRKEFRTYNTETDHDVVVLKDIPFFSFCEHHLLPFFGQVHIAYRPKRGVVGGFSHFVTLVHTISRRLQLQERLGGEIADALMEVLDPEGVLVVIEARHLCVEMRGEKPMGSRAVTMSARGKLEALKEKSNALSLMGIKE